MTRLLTALSTLALLLAGLVLAAPAQAQDPAYPTLGLPPAGANDWTCRPTAARPDPAVIVHGTFGDQKSLLDNLSLALKNDGYCVYSLDYGNRGTGRIQRSAHQLKRFVSRVLASTGAAKVEMVGHSQGGMMPRYYIKDLGGADKVEDLVGLVPSNHGTTRAGAGNVQGCRACAQQVAGSAFLRALNHPDETPGPVDYTQVTTTHDEVVVPYTSAFLEPGPHSTNIVLQDRCPGDPAEHLSIPMDPQAIAWVLDAFDRNGPARADKPIGCTGVRIRHL
ncbi:MAG: esterase/lipase family protein [Nocardioidaceae bacterium]